MAQRLAHYDFFMFTLLFHAYMAIYGSMFVFWPIYCSIYLHVRRVLLLPLLLIHCKGFNKLLIFATLMAPLDYDCLQQRPFPEAKITRGTSWKRVIGSGEHILDCVS